MKKRILAFIGAILVLAMAIFLPISAASPPLSNVPYETILNGWYNSYPYRNLIQYPYDQSSTVINGLTIVHNNDGSVQIFGTATQDTYYYLKYTVSLEVGKTYTLSGCPAGGGSSSYSLTLSEPKSSPKLWHPDYGNGSTFVANNTSGSLYIFVKAGIDADFIFMPMLNEGNEVQPYVIYVPYHDRITYNDGYTEGNNDGYSSGYNLGYKEGEQSTVTKDFSDIIESIIMSPYYLASNIFDFEIFGFNVAGTIFQIISSICVLWVVGKLLEYIF